MKTRQLLDSLVSQQKRYLLCYQWLHEDLLSAGTGQTNHCQPRRKEVLTELHKVINVTVFRQAVYTDSVMFFDYMCSVISIFPSFDSNLWLDDFRSI